MKKNSMGLNKYEYAAYLRELASIALQSAHDEDCALHAASLYDLADECRVSARYAEAASFLG